MIVCHEHRFIFLKTNKTAGTSVEIALSLVCSPEDILSPFDAEDEKLRIECGGQEPANYLAPRSDWGFHDWRRFLYKNRLKRRFYHHMPASEVKPLLGEEIWNSYFKFCIERNPWDRVVSYYYWHHRRSHHRKVPSLSKFIASDQLLSLKARGFGLYTIDGKVVVDRVCRFERIRDELEEVGTHLGLPKTLELPRTKTGTRKDKRHYRDILTDADRQRIAELFAEEIELFNYSF